MGDKKAYKVTVKGANAFVNVGVGKNDKPYASMSTISIRKLDKRTEQWEEAKSWFLDDAYTARNLLDKCIAFMEQEVAPVEKFKRKGKGDGYQEVEVAEQEPMSFDEGDEIPF